MAEPKRKFRGTWTPAELYTLMENGTITTTEFVLLGIIDSLVDGEGEGCWASRSYLAKRIDKSIRHVKTMVQHLKELGLIEQVGWKTVNGQKRAILETQWSRVSVQLSSAIDSTERLSSAIDSTTSKKKEREKEREKEKERSKEREREREREREKKKDQSRGCSATPDRVTSVHLPSSKSNSLFFNDITPSMKLVQRLKTILESKNLIMRRVKLKSWDTWMKQLLLEQDLDHIMSVLDWYSQNIGNDYVPDIRCGETFYHKFKKLENAIEREKRQKLGPGKWVETSEVVVDEIENEDGSFTVKPRHVKTRKFVKFEKYQGDDGRWYTKESDE